MTRTQLVISVAIPSGIASFQLDLEIRRATWQPPIDPRIDGANRGVRVAELMARPRLVGRRRVPVPYRLRKSLGTA